MGRRGAKCRAAERGGETLRARLSEEGQVGPWLGAPVGPGLHAGERINSEQHAPQSTALHTACLWGLDFKGRE